MAGKNTPVPPGGPNGQGSAGTSSAGVSLADMTADQWKTYLNGIIGTASPDNAGQMTNSSPIYLSQGGAPHHAGENPLARPASPQWNTLTYDQARLLPSQWMESDPNMLKQLVNKGILNKVPGFQVGMGMPDIISAWDELVKSSYEMNQSKTNGAKKWTPWDVLDTYGNTKMNFGTVRQGDWLYDIATGAKVKYVGPKSKTTTSRDVNLSSAEDVKALTTQVLTQALGRAPTAAEVAQYKSTINAQENENPTLTTTTQTMNDQGEVGSQSTKTTGGFDSTAQAQLVQDQAAKSPEFAKYQSGTTYWNALMQMMTGG